MSEISIQVKTINAQQRLGVAFENIILASCSPIKEGLGQKTGEPWRIMYAIFRFSLADGSYMHMRFKLRGVMIDRVSSCQPGTIFNAFVRIDVEGSNYLSNEFNVLDINVTSNPQ